jgi:hypothetical protein
MDLDPWDWDATVDGDPFGTLGAILESRFTREEEEYVALTYLAQTLGISPHELIKQATARNHVTLAP